MYKLCCQMIAQCAIIRKTNLLKAHEAKGQRKPNKRNIPLLRETLFQLIDLNTMVCKNIVILMYLLKYLATKYLVTNI